LIARKVIHEREGQEVENKLADYADPTHENYRQMVGDICKKLNFTSLQYNRLDDMVDAIGIEPRKLCTYCWNRKG
jgi:amidophosphoribosyltransferase